MGKNADALKKYLADEEGKGANFLYIFMRLSKPADQKTFHLLNDLAKALRVQQPLFHTYIRGNIRNKMTRVKLACEHDMSSGFLALDPDSTVNPKFKYGHQPTTKLRIGLVLKPGQANDANVIAKRKANAMNYDAMLARATGVNEITIVYRQHESFRKTDGEKFPLLTRLVVDGRRTGFQAFTLSGSTTNDAGQRFIPDDTTLAR